MSVHHRATPGPSEPLAGDRKRRAKRISRTSAGIETNYGKRDTREHGAHFVPPNRANRAIASLSQPPVRIFLVTAARHTSSPVLHFHLSRTQLHVAPTVVANLSL